MKKRRLIALIVLLAAALLLPAVPALADEGPPGDGVIIWDEDYTVEEGETLDGDLVVFNGDVTIEDGGSVEGSVVIWNGSADVHGTVEGDLVVSSGDVYLGEDSLVEGNVVCTWNCDIEREVGAQIGGSITEGAPWRGFRFDEWDEAPFTMPSPVAIWASGPGMVLDLMLQVARSVVSVLVVAAVAGLVALIWPDQTARVGQTVVEAPGASLGVGLLTVFAAGVLAVALIITICLPPFVAMALVAAGLFGWICIGALVGERLLVALKAREIAPLWAAGLGTLVISVLAAGLGLVPCVNVFGWLLIFVTGCLGLGAVVLTRFGTMAYVPSRSAPLEPAPEPIVAEEPVEPEPPEPKKKPRKRKTTKKKAEDE
jgi:hypothetical protein